MVLGTALWMIMMLSFHQNISITTHLLRYHFEDCVRACVRACVMCACVRDVCACVRDVCVRA